MKKEVERSAGISSLVVCFWVLSLNPNKVNRYLYVCNAVYLSLRSKSLSPVSSCLHPLEIPVASNVVVTTSSPYHIVLLL